MQSRDLDNGPQESEKHNTRQIFFPLTETSLTVVAHKMAALLQQQYVWTLCPYKHNPHHLNQFKTTLDVTLHLVVFISYSCILKQLPAQTI